LGHGVVGPGDGEPLTVGVAGELREAQRPVWILELQVDAGAPGGLAEQVGRKADGLIAVDAAHQTLPPSAGHRRWTGEGAGCAAGRAR
jgi:hypothetical protein